MSAPSEKILGWYKRNSWDPNLFLRCCHEKLASYRLTIGPRICCLLHNLSSFATSPEHYFWCPNRYQTHFFTTSRKRVSHILRWQVAVCGGCRTDKTESRGHFWNGPSVKSVPITKWYKAENKWNTFCEGNWITFKQWQHWLANQLSSPDRAI